jgi:hypothetical protein
MVAKNETASMSEAIASQGLDFLWKEIDKFIYSEGATPYKNISDGIATMTYTKDLGNGAQMFREYSINLKTQQCRCIIKINPMGLQASNVREYTLPQKQQVSDAQAVSENMSQYLGIITSAEKTKEGGFTILEVATGGLSEFAGIKKGDILIKIDTYDIKEHDFERVVSYVALRCKQKAIIKATMLRNGKPKVIEMQL